MKQIYDIITYLYSFLPFNFITQSDKIKSNCDKTRYPRNDSRFYTPIQSFQPDQPFDQTSLKFVGPAFAAVVHESELLKEWNPEVLAYKPYK